MQLEFYKYQGTGNDFVMVDDRAAQFEIENQKFVAKLCDRKFGIGADGLILLRNHPDYDFQMIYFNADGREGSMCGNGGRCIVSFAHYLGVFERETTFIAVDGVHHASIENYDWVSLKMNDLEEWESEETHHFLDTGSPHHVEFVEKLSAFDVVGNGEKIRHSVDYASIGGTNVNFIEKVAESKIAVRTFERGVENETLSCGTGVTAAALVSSFSGVKSPVSIQTIGGDLEVSFEKENDKFSSIFLKGPAQMVFKGKIDI